MKDDKIILKLREAQKYLDRVRKIILEIDGALNGKNKK